MSWEPWLKLWRPQQGTRHSNPVFQTAISRNQVYHLSGYHLCLAVPQEWSNHPHLSSELRRSQYFGFSCRPQQRCPNSPQPLSFSLSAHWHQKHKLRTTTVKSKLSWQAVPRRTPDLRAKKRTTEASQGGHKLAKSRKGRRCRRMKSRCKQMGFTGDVDACHF